MVPLFPKFKLIKKSNFLILKSNIHIHEDCFSHVKVFNYEVESTFIFKHAREKNLIIENHLRDCLRQSKYLDISSVDTTKLELVNILDKTSKDFLETLHFQYP